MKQYEEDKGIRNEEKSISATKRAGAACSRGLRILRGAAIIAAMLYLGLFLLSRGPFREEAELFVRTVEETNQGRFLARMFYREEEIEQILISGGANAADKRGDSWEPIQIPEDEDGDGLVLLELKGEYYDAWMLAVLDPARVVLGAVPEDFGRQGHSLEYFVQSQDAAAGINGGAFLDPVTGEPDGLTVIGGTIYNDGVGNGFAGLNQKDRLCTDIRSAKQAQQARIRDGCSFGPVLIKNGEICLEEDHSGLNPRTAIGQREDGTILMLVIDGRQLGSFGATLTETAELLLRCGAVNAVNLDGGSSAALYYDGKYQNRGCSLQREDSLATVFLVLQQGSPEQESN